MSLAQCCLEKRSHVCSRSRSAGRINEANVQSLAEAIVAMQSGNVNQLQQLLDESVYLKRLLGERSHSIEVFMLFISTSGTSPTGATIDSRPFGLSRVRR